MNRSHPSKRPYAVVVAAAIALALCLACAGSASAYSVGEDATAPWPFDTITYYNASHFPKSVKQAVRSWNKRSKGSYHFKRVKSRNKANVLFLTTDRQNAKCSGSTIHGYNFAQAFVILNGKCDRFLMTLAAAHELGHVISLEHETHACAVMNPRSLANRSKPRLARPAHCRRGPQYWRAPIRRDDRRGARVARKRPFSFPVDFCFDPDGTFQSQLTADEPLCNYQWDCRGRPGTAPNGVTPSSFLLQRGCEPAPFDPSRRSKAAVMPSHPGYKRRPGDSRSSPSLFGESPGIETFGHAG